MASGLYEYSVSPNMNGKNKVLYIILNIFNAINIIIALVAFFLAFMFDNIFWILFAIFFIAIISVHIFSKTYFSSFDCLFVDGTIRLDRVFKNRRKRLLSFDCKNIRLIGGVTSNSYVNNLKNKQYKKISVNNKEFYAKDFYFIVDKNGISYIVTMRYNELFLSHVIRSINTRIIEKDYKELLVK